VYLGVDSGKRSGATIGMCADPRKGLQILRCEGVDLDTRDLELVVEHAVDLAEQYSLPLIAMLETWGRGGPLGLDQWIGLGEARGPWRRELRIRCKDTDALTLKRILLASQSRWRSLVVTETGGEVDGEWVAFDPPGWKLAAKRAAEAHFVDAYVPPDDAAESACIVVYASRSDAAAEALGARYLAKRGVVYEPLERRIFAR